MFETLEVTRMARALAAHAGARMGLVAGNLANADTPGYRARDLPDFAQVYGEAADLRATRAGHLAGGPSASARPVLLPAGLAGSPNGNSVSIEGEMVRAADIRQQHDMALAIQRSVSVITRTALGRGG